jgi:hypothetical protein
VVKANWINSLNPYKITHNNLLIAKYLRKYDYQRAKYEDPEILGNWFKLLQITITEYRIVAEDIYNFDETKFQIGVIITAKVLTQTKPSKSGSNRIKSGRPLVNQPGNRHWVTVIEEINASDWALPPTMIFESKVHQSTWYRTIGIPNDWIIGLNENGWTNDNLGYK